MAWVNSSANAISWKTGYLNKEESVKAILLALFLVLAATFSIREHDPPAAVSAAAPADMFSAERAVRHLSVIAQTPHPIGSSGHRLVQEYLVKQLSEGGLEPQIQQATIPMKVGPPLQVANIENIVARLKGTSSGPAVLLMAHYDSEPNSFGASDNGAAVASLLETLRALKAGPALKNDVIFLFTDGEENGLLGARAFVSEHQWIEDVGVVLNFDARGNTGPVLMFETNENNGWVIDQFAKASPYPVAHSLSYELYQLLPNDTDLTLFKKADIAALNFANIDGIEHYHAPLDTLQEVDQNTVQHRGSYALALTRHLANVDLSQTRQTNAVYFDLFGGFLVDYSSAWVIPLTLFVSALFVAVVILGFRKKWLTVSGIVVGFVSLFISLLAASLAGWLLWKVIWMIRPGPSAAATQSRMLLFGFVALAIAITFAVYTFVRDRAGVESLAIGALLWWVVLMLLTSIFLPGATFILHWPLLFSLIGIGWVMLSPQNKRMQNLINPLILGLCALPGIILMAPVIYQIFVGLTLNWSFMVMALLVLLFGLLLPQLRLISAPFKWVLPGASAVVAIALLVAGAVINVAPAERSFNRIYYALNADTGKAVWASDLTQRDDRSSQFFMGATEKGNLGDFAYARKSREYTLNTAPLAQLPVPELSVVEDKSVDGVRTLKMRVSSPRQAGVMSVYVDSNTEILSASINDKTLNDEPTAQWGLQIEGFPKQGVELSLRLKDSQPLKIRLVDQSSGLPPVHAAAISEPANVVAKPDLTMLAKSFSL